MVSVLTYGCSDGSTGDAQGGSGGSLSGGAGSAEGGAAGGGTGGATCDQIDCGHGTCVASASQVTCDCDEGYEADGLTCVPTEDPGAPPCSLTITDGLVAALEDATPGDVICLAAGDYPFARLENIQHSADVTVRPADGATVAIQGLVINSCAHLRFTGLGGTLAIAGIDVDQVDGNPASRWMTVDNIDFTEAITLRARETDLQWLIHKNTFKNIAAALWEGRISVRGYGATGDQKIVISQNLFSGGGAEHSSDGVQLIDGARGVVIRGNEFTNIIQGNYPEHADPIQLYGARDTIVDRNYFHDNGNGTGGLVDFDATAPGTIVTHNVFHSTGIYPWAVAANSAQDWRVEHNTFIGSSLRIDGQPSGNIVRDNVFVDAVLSLEGGGVDNDHNLNCGHPGTGNLTGTPTFVGGALPTTFAGFALAPGSLGENASSSGTNIGVIP